MSQQSFDSGRNHGLRLSQEDDEVRLSLSSLASTSVIDLCLGWSYLPLAIPVYHGISLVIWEIKPKDVCFFLAVSGKPRFFDMMLLDAFMVNYGTNYLAVLVGIICFLPKISPVQWHMTEGRIIFCHELGEEYLKRTLEIVVEEKVFFCQVSWRCCPLCGGLWMTDASAVSFIHSF